VITLRNIYKTKRIVAVGGGHGLGRVLAALSDFGPNVSGIVTTTDNGGSTGRIRHCQGGIAWGDMRNCINQLITEPTISSMMFEYRFKGSGELNGHNLGNLMLTALDNLSVRPLDAINLIRAMLSVNLNLFPMSEHPSDLSAVLSDGRRITGETSVDEMKDDLIRLELLPEVPATREAVTEIEQADAIILGPGSFLTSIMPPLLLREISHAIAVNSKATLIYIENLALEHGPAGRMSLEKKLHWCERACEGRTIDVILGSEPHPELHNRWRTVTKDLASPNFNWRHDRLKLKQAVEELLI
jgi:uncharacterized cofD-like protein